MPHQFFYNAKFIIILKENDGVKDGGNKDTIHINRFFVLINLWEAT